MNFLVRMPEGARVSLWRTGGTDDAPQAQLLGWLEKVRGGRFLTSGFAEEALKNPVSGGNVDRFGAVEAIARARPEYATHTSHWQEGWRPEPVREVTPRVREMVRRVISDPGSGGSPNLERRKVEYWLNEERPGGMSAGALTVNALLSLGFPDTPDGVAAELAPTAAEAFGEFKAARQDLDPW